MSAPRFPVITSMLPLASRSGDAQSCLQQVLVNLPPEQVRSRLSLAPLIDALAGNAPYLAQLIAKYPEQLLKAHGEGCSQTWAILMQEITSADITHLTQAELMRCLRQFKARAALTIAIADVSGEWPLPQVTQALSSFACCMVGITLRYLLLAASKRGELKPAHEAHPERDSGIIVLGMGKLGAFELNYSSDIDLIILFDKTRLPYHGQRNAQQFMNRLAADLVSILQERDADGYVFRTDLRLRPDPMSTPLAVTTAAALNYYETVGQNWERAAMIKARPVAGDIPAAETFLRELIPFVWRKTLDFATIADIHSIKRQMNATKGRDVAVAGHNIKTGAGGIREIEFFVATQQLVWGGRIPQLRVRGTLEGLREMAEIGMITPEVRDYLTHSYYYLRMLEHRLQMRHDEQTHTVPTDTIALQELAVFCGYASMEDFIRECGTVLNHVHRIYTDSMVGTEPLAVEGALVFTGVEADSETLKTLARLGYHEGQRISDIIQGWHRGHRRSTRSKRSRQVLTELVPALLTALSKTADPDLAFFHFDDFIGRLPSGAQIFSLFHTRPEMLSLLADILGSAPALGDTLSNDPSLLDSVLEADFFLGLPSKEELENIVVDRLRYTHDYEQKMTYLRIFNNEKRFQAGVHLLKRLASPKRVGAFLSDVAEVILQSAMQEVWSEYESKSGSHKTTPPLASIPFAVLALGKLGGREMTFGSDLDIVFLYDDAGDGASDARAHMARIAQRFTNALTLLSREGRLYEVDTRLRPGGTDGPLATSLTAFDDYFEKSAWTYEFMALTRARIVASNEPGFAARIEEIVRKHILKPRDEAKLLADVIEMRERIAKQFSTQNPWAIKHVRGGMVDIDFIAQYLILRDARLVPDLWKRSARAVFEAALAHGTLDAAAAQQLIAAKKFLSDLLSLQRLSAPGGAITDDAPAGLKRLLTRGMRVKPFSALKAAVLEHEANVLILFNRMAGDKL